MPYTATKRPDLVLLEAGRLLATDFTKYENRNRQYGALNAFKAGSQMLFGPDRQKTENSMQRPASIPVLQRFSPTVLTARSCDITGQSSTSALAALSWITRGFEAEIASNAFHENYKDAAEVLQHQIQRGIDTVMTALDVLAVAKLESEKTASITAGGPYTAGTGAYAYSGDLKMQYLSIPALMQSLDMAGPFVDVASNYAQVSAREAGIYGEANEANIKSTLGGIDFYFTNRITPPVGPPAANETHYVSPEGSLGILNWVDQDSRLAESRREAITAGSKEWVGTMELGGFTWGVFKDNSCGDKSSEQVGAERTKIEKYQFTADFALVTAYSSGTDSPIVRIDATKA